MAKLKTDQKHRFGKSIQIKSKAYTVSSEGIIEVEEDMIVYAIENGFELVDKSIKFQSLEEHAKIKEVEGIINSAKLQAEEIIKQAHKEAEKIVKEAEDRVAVALTNGRVEEIEEMRNQLKVKTVKELTETLLSSGAKAEELKALKKDDLINLIIEGIYSK